MSGLLTNHSYAQLFEGRYRFDCDSMLLGAPEFAKSCKEHRFPLRTYKISADQSGAWQTEPALSGSAASQQLKAREYLGFACLEAQFVMLCKVPLSHEIEVISGMPPVKSKTGFILFVTNAGVLEIRRLEE